MTIIELEALPNGAHRNQTVTELEALPSGWAFIPDEFLEVWRTSGPFVEVTASDGVITSMLPGVWPDPVPAPEPELSPMEQRIAELEDAVIELAAIIAGEGE